ncbi:MAG: amidohydrolase family protein [Bacilli bacterium]|jgi:predicted TIM-barrel fold metal-dependent hydrolase
MKKDIINIHSHFNHGVQGDTQSNEITYKCGIDFLEGEARRLGVTKMAVSSFASVLSSQNVVAENEFLFELCAQSDFWYQWVVIDPRNPETFKQAERMLTSQKCLGIKLHSIYHQYNLATYADQVFAFANRLRAVVMIHPEQLDEVVRIANKYPHMVLIIAHLGAVEHVEAIKKAKYHHIYTDTSGSASSQNYIIEYAVKEIGSTRILFGTDTYSTAFQLGRIVFADITEEDKENILYRNAERLFANKFSK